MLTHKMLLGLTVMVFVKHSNTMNRGCVKCLFYFLEGSCILKSGNEFSTLLLLYYFQISLEYLLLLMSIDEKYYVNGTNKNLLSIIAAAINCHRMRKVIFLSTSNGSVYCNLKEEGGKKTQPPT